MRRGGVCRLFAVLAGLLGMQCALAAQAATRPHGEPDSGVVRVEGDHLDQTVRCDGHAIEITGSDSRLSVLGPCTAVRILGSRNWLTVGLARTIVTRGNQNTVEYAERRTRVSDLGRANTVAEKWPQ